MCTTTAQHIGEFLRIELQLYRENILGFCDSPFPGEPLDFAEHFRDNALGSLGFGCSSDFQTNKWEGQLKDLLQKIEKLTKVFY